MSKSGSEGAARGKPTRMDQTKVPGPAPTGVGQILSVLTSCSVGPTLFS